MSQLQRIFEFKNYNGIFAVHEYGFHGFYFYDFNQWFRKKNSIDWILFLPIEICFNRTVSSDICFDKSVDWSKLDPLGVLKNIHRLLQK